MTPAQAFAALRRLPPEQALEFLRSRGLITQSWSWADLRADEFAIQFTVSRLAAVDVLADLQELIIRSVGGALTRADFARDAKALLEKKGWWGLKEVQDPVTGETVTTRFNPARLTLIYDTNVRQAGIAGQWERVQATKRMFPFLRYVTQADERVRSEHAAWHNLVLPVDDPWWDTHTPQNAYRCRCYVVSMSQRQYDRGTSPTGAPLNKQAPSEELREWENPRTGVIIKVPKGVHPAFAGNPGKDRLAGLQRLEAEKLTRLRQRKGGTA